MSHSERVADLLARLDDAAKHFTSRLESAGPRAEESPTGWSPAQIGAHVALVNATFAAVIDGTAPGAVPPADEFSERPWADIANQIPARLEAPSRVAPPPTVSTSDAVEQVRQSADRLAQAIASLTPERAAYCHTNRLVGTVTLYQIGEWAIAHIDRHNQQAKRLLDA